MHNKCEHSDTHVMTTAQTTECMFAHTHREMDTHIHSNTLTNCKDNLYNYASQLALIFWQLTCICSWIKPIYTQHTFAHNTCAITLIHINSWGARNNHTHTHLHSHRQTVSINAVTTTICLHFTKPSLMKSTHAHMQALICIDEAHLLVQWTVCQIKGSHKLS